MKLRASLCVLLLAVSSLSFADPIVWDENGHTYEVITLEASLTWDEAVALAEEMGGHLATITSADENDFIANLVSTDGVGNLERYWLGGYQVLPGDGNCEPENCWAWVMGEEWDFTNWEVGEPNNGVGGTQHYLHYWSTPGMWDDMENRAVMSGFVVEYSVPEPGTLGLLGLGLLALGVSRRRKVL